MAKGKRTNNKQLRLMLSLCLVFILISGIYTSMGDPLGILDEPADAPIHAPFPQETDFAQTFNGTLDVYILDVGQGDSIFLRSPSGKTMLVDASISSMYETIDAFLKEQKLERLDVVIATHPHSDHIGAMEKVIRNYEIGVFYLPNATHTSKTFEKMLDALNDKNTRVIEAVAGNMIDWDDDVEVRILSPVKDQKYEDLNNVSVVCRVRYGDTAVMLTGDAEVYSEKLMLKEFPKSYFEATILKAGHHGSSTSTSAAFFEAVQPKAAVMSLGKDNTYGHPHKEIIALFKDAGIPAYRTDQDGTVHISLNGKDFTIETKKQK